MDAIILLFLALFAAAGLTMAWVFHAAPRVRPATARDPGDPFRTAA
jgi:hypothetical protein